MPYIGEIRIMGSNWAPVGWMLCDGTPLPISENESLFNLIGTTYGGDGQETFNLPDLRGRLPVHQDELNGYPLAMTAGTESVTLTTQQIPVHTHPLLASTNAAVQTSPTGNVLAQSTTVDLYIEDVPVANLAAPAISPVGGSQPHSNEQPFLAVTFIISLFGDFPTQT